MMVRKKKGQGTVEYLVLIGLIIVVLVTVARTMQGQVSGGLGNLATSVGDNLGNLTK